MVQRVTVRSCPWGLSYRCELALRRKARRVARVGGHARGSVDAARHSTLQLPAAVGQELDAGLVDRMAADRGLVVDVLPRHRRGDLLAAAKRVQPVQEVR